MSTAYAVCSASTAQTSNPTSQFKKHNLLNVENDCSDSVASALAITSTTSLLAKDHSYIRPTLPRDSRAPCPGLNTLANHGYIPRSGCNIPFTTLVHALMEVYNISLPLALMLAVPGFLLYAQFRIHWKSSTSSCLKIAHRASLVHPDYPSDRPDTNMLNGLLSYSRSQKLIPTLSDEKLVATHGGLTLFDLASLRVSRESTLSAQDTLDRVHEQVALGESALTWLLFAKTGSPSSFIPISYLAQWYGEERIPDGWMRPSKAIGFVDARKTAGLVQKEMVMISS
ncbi:Chloroperoxidase [Lentinula aciculospora]|uniref:Chloroperoxidase n=1 Tax=Lentinula aciculospora TaxID=153920 RepID=A0A9W9DQ94_9AGAR|nr:Chloroperoxidase [Lentinula aciculospora]